MIEPAVPHPAAELVAQSGVPALMHAIRPDWQAKGLIDRVRRLLPVDPSSACQRLLNAAVHDLREKILIAGIDVASEAASSYRLPPVNRAEDVERYPTAPLLDLCYRMGLLTRPEWRRMTRAYDIRRDLEHEDSEYEAGIEDCVYIFKTCIEAVLSRDPINLIKVAEVKDIIQAPGPIAPDNHLLEDYERAPNTRQEEIQKFLISEARNDSEPDLVRQNAFVMLQRLNHLTRNPVRVSVAKFLQGKLQREPLTELDARVANAAGILPYLRKAQRRDFFSSFLDQLDQVGHNWRSHADHGDLLRTVIECGGLDAIPEEIRRRFIRWMTLCYMGEPGGYGAGINRKVFFSDRAAPIIEEIFQDSRKQVRGELDLLQGDKDVTRATQNEHVARRFQELLDLVAD